MSDTWEATRASVRKLKSALSNADEDTRYSFAFWTIGLAAMTVAILVQFGWPGVLFCSGFIVWKISGL